MSKQKRLPNSFYILRKKQLIFPVVKGKLCDEKRAHFCKKYFHGNCINIIKKIFIDYLNFGKKYHTCRPTLFKIHRLTVYILFSSSRTRDIF